MPKDHESTIKNTNAQETMMKGYIIASINQKTMKQSAGLDSHLIQYTPVLSEDLEEIQKQFAAKLPDQTILMTIPIKVLKKNIQALEKMAEKMETQLE